MQRIGFNVFKALNDLAFEEVGTEANSFDIGAVNISYIVKGGAGFHSATDLCVGKIGQEAVNRLYDRGIPVITGMDNSRVPANEVTWPQCLDKVINVGASDASPTSLVSQFKRVGIGANQLHFFAKGTKDGRRGNSLAAPRIAAAYTALAKAFPFASVEEKTQALINANSRMKEYKQRDTNGSVVKEWNVRNVRKGDIPEAKRLLGLIFPDNITNEQVIAANSFKFTDNKSYGVRYGEPSLNSYSFNVRLDALTPIFTQNRTLNEPPTANTAVTTISNRRDIIVGFTGSFSNTGVNGFKIIVNGQLAHTTDDFLSFQEEKNYAITIHRKYFTDGNNTINIEPNISARRWGVRNISANFAPVIPLTVDETDTGVYGYLRNPARLTGMRASFNLDSVEQDLSLSMTGWDIDTVDETSIFLNGTHLGVLATGNSSAYTKKQRFVLPQNLLRRDLNYIELVQRETGADWEGFEDEKWGVKDLQIRIKGESVITPILMLLFDD